MGVVERGRGTNYLHDWIKQPIIGVSFNRLLVHVLTRIVKRRLSSFHVCRAFKLSWRPVESPSTRTTSASYCNSADTEFLAGAAVENGKQNDDACYFSPNPSRINWILIMLGPRYLKVPRHVRFIFML